MITLKKIIIDNMKDRGDDYNYIIRIINYLDTKYKISFFISAVDFDTLYGWRIKRIPMNIIFESIDNVVKRHLKRGRKIDGFKRFSYEVRKNFNNLMELKVADNSSQNFQTDNTDEEIFNTFIDNLPNEIKDLTDDFKKLFYEKNRETKQNRLDMISKKLLKNYEPDKDLELKTKKFLMNLNPKIRTEEMENKYKLNYLFSKLSIPDFLLFFPDSDVV